MSQPHHTFSVFENLELLRQQENIPLNLILAFLQILSIKFETVVKTLGP